MHVYNPAHLLGGRLRVANASKIGTELHQLFVHLIGTYGGKVPRTILSKHRTIRFMRHCEHISLVIDNIHPDYLKVTAGNDLKVIAWLEFELNIGRLGNWQLARQPEKANFRGDAGRFTSDTSHLLRNLWQQLHAATKAADVIVAARDYDWVDKAPAMFNAPELATVDVRSLVNTAFTHYRTLHIESRRFADRMSEFLCRAGHVAEGVALSKFYGAYARDEVTAKGIAGIPWSVARHCL